MESQDGDIPFPFFVVAGAAAAAVIFGMGERWQGESESEWGAPFPA